MLRFKAFWLIEVTHNNITKDLKLKTLDQLVLPEQTRNKEGFNHFTSKHFEEGNLPILSGLLTQDEKQLTTVKGIKRKEKKFNISAIDDVFKAA